MEKRVALRGTKQSARLGGFIGRFGDGLPGWQTAGVAEIPGCRAALAMTLLVRWCRAGHKNYLKNVGNDKGGSQGTRGGARQTKPACAG